MVKIMLLIEGLLFEFIGHWVSFRIQHPALLEIALSGPGNAQCFGLTIIAMRFEIDQPDHVPGFATSCGLETDSGKRVGNLFICPQNCC